MNQVQSERRCSKCEKIKPITEFYHDAASPLGRSYQCKECTKIRAKQYRHDHPEKHREQERRRRVRRAPHIAEQKAKWYAENVETAKARIKEWTQRRRKESPEHFHDLHLRRTYGIPLGTYAKLLAEQNEGCAICGNPPTPRERWLHLDHCHDTGKVRALLCMACNTTLGRFRHDPTTIEKAIAYLLKYS
jgi:hypothetical protein